MNKIHFTILFAAFLCGAAQTVTAVEPYPVTVAQIESVKKMFDDPSPFYTNCEYYKKWIPQDVWEKITYDEEAMKRAWEEVVGFKAMDRVGKIAPEVLPGKYVYTDKEKYPLKDLMTPHHYNRFNPPGQGTPNHIGNFTEMEVVPTRQYFYALPIAEATKRNEGLTKQDGEGYLLHETYRGGYPFPKPSGPHKAMQIIYNVTKRYRNGEDVFNIDYIAGINNKFKIDHQGSADFLYLQASARVMSEPLGYLDERAEKMGEQKIILYKVYSPRDFYGNVYYAVQYSDPRKPNNIMVYVNILRRIRKMSSSDSQDQAVGQDMCFDDTDGFAQQLNPDEYPYEFKILEDREFLVPAWSLDGASWLDSKEKFLYRGLKFERRPLWVIEMKQLDPNYIYSKRIVYVDQETFLPYLWEYYDQKGRLYRTFDCEWGFIKPMGLANQYHVVNLDYIDVHSSFTFGPAYPALWLTRKEVSLSSAMEGK